MIDDIILNVLLTIVEKRIPEVTIDPLPICIELEGLGKIAVWTCGDRVCMCRLENIWFGQLKGIK